MGSTLCSESAKRRLAVMGRMSLVVRRHQNIWFVPHLGLVVAVAITNIILIIGLISGNGRRQTDILLGLFEVIKTLKDRIIILTTPSLLPLIDYIEPAQIVAPSCNRLMLLLVFLPHFEALDIQFWHMCHVLLLSRLKIELFNR